MTKKKRTPTERLAVNLPLDKMRIVRAVQAQLGMTQRDLVVEALDAWLENRPQEMASVLKRTIAALEEGDAAVGR